MHKNQSTSLSEKRKKRTKTSKLSCFEANPDKNIYKMSFQTPSHNKTKPSTKNHKNSLSARTHAHSKQPKKNQLQRKIEQARQKSKQKQQKSLTGVKRRRQGQQSPENDAKRRNISYECVNSDESE